jgi:xyloglucan-specific exo-beta-1,4-glucanase
MDTPRVSRRAVLAAGAAAAASQALPSTAVAAGPRYTWRNVTIGGGGGFVPGIVFNQAERDLIYARTDIGGAYRWNRAGRRWTPLLDSIGWANWGHTGVASIATDAVEPRRVYAAVGTYTNDWDPNNGAILRSTDRGATWKASALPFKLGGNMPGRGIGERLAIDPNRNNILFLAAPGGNGLWRSGDFGATWAKVASFPNAGDFAPDPNDTSGYSSAKLGVLWVAFDPRTESPRTDSPRTESTGDRRRATQTIYVGVADKAKILYRSTDAGASWELVPGQPTGYLPHKAVLDHVGGLLYLATSDTAGPYDGGKGDVWKLDLATGGWTLISPVPSTSSEDSFGYSGLTIDRQHPGTLMVATQISWWPDVVFFRSTDSGATWTRAWQYGAVWPERRNRYDLNIAEAPWLTWNASPGLPEQAPKLGWMTESLEIDPFDGDRLLYGTGATIYGTQNLTDWDAGTVHISVHAIGVEETAVLDLISPPAGAHLLSAVGDIGGYLHTDLTRPSRMFDHPTMGTTTSLDFAELAPAVIVRVGNPSAGVPHFGSSTDGGATWTPAATEPTGVTSGGTVAVGSDGSRSVWAPGGAPVSHSTDRGATWVASSGVPAGAAVESDRRNPLKFYAVSGGVFALSVDGGATFTPTGASGLPTEGGVRFKALPGVEGDVWLAGGKDGGTYGLWHSIDSGASFTRLSTVEQADTIGFGKPAPGRRYPALFTSAQIAGVRGIFRSDDAGGTWTRINDDQHQYGWTGAAITGDPRVYGRVYVATNGRGIIVGDRD